MRIMVAMLGGLLLSGAASATAFQNGSFELGDTPATQKSVGIGSTAITGWTVIDNGNPGANVEWDNNANGYGISALDGSYSIDLSGNPDYGGSGLRQIFDTIAGHTYALTFSVGLNTQYTSGTALVTASIDGTAFYTVGNGDTSKTQTWNTGSKQFVATSGSTTLDLVQAGGGNYTGLDKVSVVDLTPDAPAAAPEPASWAMMVGGFGLLGYALRRNRTGRNAIA